MTNCCTVKGPLSVSARSESVRTVPGEHGAAETLKASEHNVLMLTGARVVFDLHGMVCNTELHRFRSSSALECLCRAHRPTNNSPLQELTTWGIVL